MPRYVGGWNKCRNHYAHGIQTTCSMPVAILSRGWALNTGQVLCVFGTIKTHLITICDRQSVAKMIAGDHHQYSHRQSVISSSLWNSVAVCLGRRRGSVSKDRGRDQRLVDKCWLLFPFQWPNWMQGEIDGWVIKTCCRYLAFHSASLFRSMFLKKFDASLNKTTFTTNECTIKYKNNILQPTG